MDCITYVSRMSSVVNLLPGCYGRTIVVTTCGHDLSDKNLCVFHIFEVMVSKYLDNQLLRY